MANDIERQGAFLVHLKTGEPFFLAGLWDCWHEGKPDALASYILMTTEPNEIAAKVHDRMPVMLHAGDVARWVDPAITDADHVVDLLGSYPAEEMAARPVSRRVCTRGDSDLHVLSGIGCARLCIALRSGATGT